MLNKIAVDEMAKKYWEQLFADYGVELVSDVPRRIKASLVDNKKVASSDSFTVMPVAIVKSANGVIIEGTYSDDSSHLVFCASLNDKCEVVSIESMEIK